MILSDRDIMAEVYSGRINIDPFNIDQVQPNSYDFRLGQWYCMMKEPDPNKIVYNPYFDECIWENPEKATTHIYFLPGTTTLCHSKEVMGGLDNITTEMKTRSSMARIGIDVCKSAGVGDVGYNNIWTLEVTNTTKWVIKLPVGCRIGQMIFLRTGQTARQYSGNYVQTAEVWDPKSMLPKFNKDKI